MHSNELDQLILGNHASVKALKQLIIKLAPSSFPILITGETGTGKELVAQAIHRGSAVSRGPLEIVNCGSIPHGLAESELFGHAQGAFTGATRRHIGAFERAHGGTLFLDEIGELPLELQPKLLRILEDNVVRPVGDARLRQVRVRIVAATHRNLEREVFLDRFRLDLFHRLAIGIIHAPPLRERKEDIESLVAHFLRRASTTARLSRDVIDWLVAQPWPGNIRGLKNAIERATALNSGELRISDFKTTASISSMGTAREGFVQYAGRKFEEVRKEVYCQVLSQNAGNRSAAAMALGIPKSTFFDQLRALGI